MVPKSQSNPQREYDANLESRPYVIWYETLPSGDTVRASIAQRSDAADVVVHWNGLARWNETCASVAEAERLAWMWWNELPSLMDVGPHDLANVALPWA